MFLKLPVYLFVFANIFIFSGYKKISSPSSRHFVLPVRSFVSLRKATKLCLLLREATKLFFFVLLVFLPSSARKGDCYVLLCSVGFLYYGLLVLLCSVSF